MIKIIASDMDGTLLNSDVEISKENVKAIETARANGVHFVICTGRMYKDAIELSNRAKLHAPAICMNGAEIRDADGNILLQHTIDKDLARKTYKILTQQGLYTEVFTEIGPITTNRKIGKAFMIEMQKKLHPEFSSNEISKKIEERFEAKDVHEMTDPEELFGNDELHVFKFIGFSADLDRLAEAKKQLSKNNLLAVSSSAKENIEITNTAAQKGISLQYYAEKLGVSLAETFAIGDNHNDISMLKMAGYSVAMGNAEDAVKKVATYTTTTNNENGVATAIYEMLKNNK